MKIKAFNRTFETQKDLAAFLKANSNEILSLKKAAVKNSDPINLSIIGHSETVKALAPKEEIKYGSTVFPVINTTNYMDQHDDVHVDGIWNKSVTDQQGKIYFVADHMLQLGRVISRPNEVHMIIENMPWSELGKSHSGSTEALIFKTTLSERTLKEAFEAFKNNDPVEYSIRMQYVNLKIAVNNSSKEYKAEYENWLKYFPVIANKERAEERGFFFPVLEAKIYKEGSMVLAGSNDSTRTLYDLDKNIQPPHNTNKAVISTEAISKIIHEQFKKLSI